MRVVVPQVNGMQLNEVNPWVTKKGIQQADHIKVMTRSRFLGNVLLRCISQQVEDTFWGAFEVSSRNLAFGDKGLEIWAVVESFQSVRWASFQYCVRSTLDFEVEWLMGDLLDLDVLLQSTSQIYL